VGQRIIPGDFQCDTLEKAAGALGAAALPRGAWRRSVRQLSDEAPELLPDGFWQRRDFYLAGCAFWFLPGDSAVSPAQDRSKS
jgi:hypothetical protein